MPVAPTTILPEVDVALTARADSQDPLAPLNIWVQHFPGTAQSLSAATGVVTDVDGNTTQFTGAYHYISTQFNANGNPLVLDPTPGLAGTWTVVVTIAQSPTIGNFDPINQPCAFGQGGGVTQIVVPVTVQNDAIPTGESRCGGGGSGGVANPTVTLDGVIATGATLPATGPVSASNAYSWQLNLAGVELGQMLVEVEDPANPGTWVSTSAGEAVGGADGSYWFLIRPGSIPCGTLTGGTPFNVRASVIAPSGAGQANGTVLEGPFNLGPVTFTCP
jgi:hypothetical protein